MSVTRLWKSEYDEREDAKCLARTQALLDVLDDDGFVTVPYYRPSQVGSKCKLKESVTRITNRHKGSKQSHTKREVTGASELDDFCRFQQKDTRRRTAVEELRRKRLEEDLTCQGQENER
jgi:Ribosomal RNA-processing protein 7 (RRP7) C-terminal domain